MLENFWTNVQYGINHILDFESYDHLIFLIVLAVPYLFNHWKRVLILVSTFTIGHTITLMLGAYNVVDINAKIIEFLIPITILIVAVYNIFTAGKKTEHNKISILTLSTLFFGLIHGLGFANKFKMMALNSNHKIVLFLEFALGIEIAQIIIVFIVIFLGYLMQTVFRFSKRDWMLVVSAIVVGLVIPMVLKSEFLT